MSTTTRRAGFTVAAVCLVSTAASAHELNPALVDVRAAGEDTLVELTWKPVRPDADPRLEVAETCPATRLAAGAGTSRWRLGCPVDEALTALDVVLNSHIPDAVVRVREPAGSRMFMLGAEGGPAVKATTPTRGFLGLGVEHILYGADHLLFVLGLVLLLLPTDGSTFPFRRLTLAITAFTVAHSLTLALSVLNLVSLPPRGVEAAIAASLVLLGVEVSSGEDTWSRRHPHGVAFAFGLLHGFGFAGVLREIGLPLGEVAVALVLFNVGVELGQLLFLGSLGALLWAARYGTPLIRWRWAGSYVVGTAGMYWLFERSLPLVSGVAP